VDLKRVLSVLADRGFSRVLAEGGAQVAAVIGRR